MSKAQGTIPVSELCVGMVYRDVLSGYLVLVRSLHPDQLSAAGLMWNPIHGVHVAVDVVDHQLELAHVDSMLVSPRWG